ncbi:hypothetical protein ACMD2_19909 [Ananas comosus]|uniref:Uncharacterized protein n=1 Tax=Ananas comosus TaxID=4615 RepID=A0A199VJ58_ANACO|nr:hypothetical protein ACMD2_19909 [Ananas comosus]
MGDSTAMTIDFLRARLLSERSVSRAARDRADQLAKRVVELEEQLRIVIIQRKKAEKAVAEVLAILKLQGIGDLSEGVDSSSDQEAGPSVVEGCEGTSKGDETSSGSKVGKSEVEDALSGSELGASASQVGGLLWKGRSGSPDSCKKQQAKHFRQRQRRSSFILTVESSPKYQLGMSCRKIKQKDFGSAVDDERDKTKELLDTLDYNDDQPDFYEDVSKVELCTVDDQKRETDAGGYTIRDRRDGEMERVLKQQAQLIGQYEQEENAQREWEKKFNENKSSTVNRVKLENQAHLANDDCEPKEAAVELAAEKSFCDGEAKLSVGNLSSTRDPTAECFSNTSAVGTPKSSEEIGSQGGAVVLTSDGCVPSDPIGMDNLLNKIYNELPIKEIGSILHESVYLTEGTANISPAGMHNQGPHFENSDCGSPLTDNSNDLNSNWGSLGFRNHLKNDLQLQLYETPRSRLEGVLEALHRAKLSLKEELDKSPVTNQEILGTTAVRDSLSRGTESIDSLKIPAGSAGLFRLPTDSFPKADYSGSASHIAELSLVADSNSLLAGAGPEFSMSRQGFDPQGILIPVTNSSGYNIAYSDLSIGRPSCPSGISPLYGDLGDGMPTGDRLANFYGGEGSFPGGRML